MFQIFRQFSPFDVFRAGTNALRRAILRTESGEIVRASGGEIVRVYTDRKQTEFSDLLTMFSSKTWYWFSPDSAYSDASGTVAASIDGSVAAIKCAVTGTVLAVQSTTANKPYLRRTPTSLKYWLDADSTDQLTATVGNLGTTCTIARQGATGVTWLENQTISSTVNLLVNGYNGVVGVWDGPLTASQMKAVEAVMKRSLPLNGRWNLLTWSEDFSNAAWQKSGTTFNSGALIENSALSGHSLQQAPLPKATNATVLFSARVKPIGRTRVGIAINAATAGFGTRSGYNFDLSSRTATLDYNSGGWIGRSAGVISNSDGTFTVYLSVDTNSENYAQIRLHLLNATAVLSSGAYQGDGASGVSVYSAQFEDVTGITNPTPSAYQRIDAGYEVYK